ncbi:flavin-binding monooxygenase-like protein-like protein [Lentithecium fluviatile CBS 122367]|uniref:Flavin-binding monooxygenase-like protein-like protein n=1 Tax=Lentithecium fluviatile CBS 122367 TaxID=1168545 RepID=A0A6G1JL43_9PLEO|nr:flavin-binding monooxygenase-like protein-like protein [Lentithecium fluviatile CBS 122367]
MEQSMDEHESEVIVIGAGLSGIIAAQRYLDVHPRTQLAILEQDEDIGGVFSRRRIYDTFWTQWTVGLSEFSDMRMQRPPESDCFYDFYRAKWTTNYLEQYVDRKNDKGQTLRDRIHFGIEVENIKKIGANWKIASKNREGLRQTFSAGKLMVASGLTSMPNMPDLPGAEQFAGPIIHSRDFGAHEQDILKSESIKKIAIVGGGKSSADMLYEAVKAGKEVSWIIRTTGDGAAFFALGKGKGPYKNAFELASTRAVASMSPSILNNKNWWTHFLHSTSIGTSLLKRMITKMDSELRDEANYKGRPSDKGFEKLEYDAPFFWQGTGGLLHHEDFWDLVAKNVYVYRDDIKSLAKGLVRLGNGEELKADAILCGTGWTPSIQFFHEDDLIRLGLPHDPNAESIPTTEKWSRLDTEADKIITSTYPLLANPPAHSKSYLSSTPYRLYRGMLPLQDDSILMMNHIKTGNKIFAAEIQAMWAVAYFDGNIKLPSVKNMEEQIALWVAFSRRRYLSAGGSGNNIAMESITYADTLLKDIGLSAFTRGWWKDAFAPFWPDLLGKAWVDYLAKAGKREGESGNGEDRAEI